MAERGGKGRHRVSPSAQTGEKLASGGEPGAGPGGFPLGGTVGYEYPRFQMPMEGPHEPKNKRPQRAKQIGAWRNAPRLTGSYSARSIINLHQTFWKPPPKVPLGVVAAVQREEV